MLKLAGPVIADTPGQLIWTHVFHGINIGYRSLTYSHDIDSMKYMCPYELAGGVCNDRSCEHSERLRYNAGGSDKP
jgi:hypothetical protein